jgi:gamma-glutamylcyclotransferase (GGCT)/AIG2-like uncharacterized protein YtfP
MKHILVFGSLRKNSKRGYNFDRCGKQVFIKQIKLQGFELYDWGAFPTVCEGIGEITAELHSVDETTFARIERMELGAGYQERLINIDGIDATIFVWAKKDIIKLKLDKVESGDWA